MSVGLWDRGTRWSSFRVQAGRGTTVAQFEWLVLRSRAQYICDALGELERFPLAFDLAQDPALPMSTVPVLLLWAKKVIAALGHEREACLQHLRQRLDGAAGVPWATVAGFAIVRPHHLSERPVRDSVIVDTVVVDNAGTVDTACTVALVPLLAQAGAVACRAGTTQRSERTCWRWTTGTATSCQS